MGTADDPYERGLAAARAQLSATARPPLHSVAGPEPTERATPAPTGADDDRVAALEAEVRALRAEVDALRATLRRIHRQSADPFTS